MPERYYLPRDVPAVTAPAVVEQPAPTEPEKCGRCDGCGRIADSDSGEPWTAWAELPPGSDIAVRLGIVKPIPCPSCGGSGVAG